MKAPLGPVLLIMMITILSSCYYDKESLLYGTGNAPCLDTAGTASYTQKVVPILQQNCYSCHTGSFPSGNILMGSYLADKVIAQNGKLFGAINHSPGYKPMPQGQSRLNACQVGIIKKWIDNGILNN